MDYGYKTAEEMYTIVDSYTENPAEGVKNIIGNIIDGVSGIVYDTALKFTVAAIPTSVTDSVAMSVVGDIYGAYAVVAAPLVDLLGAALAGFGLGCVSYDAAPEFWTDLSNAVLGSLGVDPVDYDTIKNMRMLVEVSEHPLLNKLVFGMPYPVLDAVRIFMENYREPVAPAVKDITISGNVRHMLGGELYHKSAHINVGTISPATVLINLMEGYTQHSAISAPSDYIDEGFRMAIVADDVGSYITSTINTLPIFYSTQNLKFDIDTFYVLKQSSWQSDIYSVYYAFHPRIVEGCSISFNTRIDYTGDGYDCCVASNRYIDINDEEFQPYYIAFNLTVYTPEGMAYLERDKRYSITNTKSYPNEERYSVWYPAAGICKSQYSNNLTYSNLAYAARPYPDSIAEVYSYDFTEDLHDTIPARIVVDDVYIPTPTDTPTTAIEPNTVPDSVGNDVVLEYPNLIVKQDPAGNPAPVPYPPYTGGDYAPATADDDTDTGMYTVFNPTLQQVRNLSDFLWSDGFIDDIKKLFGNPIDAIISLHKLYATPLTSTVEEEIKCGYIPSGVSALPVTNQFTSIDCGIIDIEEIYGNVRDYLGYIQMNLYLPFIGIIGVNPNEFMGKKMHVYYNIDVITGACVAFISVRYQNGKEKIVSMHNGNCLVTMPITAGGHSNFVNALIGVGVGMLTGNAIGATTSALGSMSQEISRSGNISSNAGALSPKKPYLLITRKVPRDFVRDTHTAGFGENKAYGQLSDFIAALPAGDNRFSVTDFYPRLRSMDYLMPDELTRISQMLSIGVVYRK